MVKGPLIGIQPEKKGKSLQSPWVSISRTWLKVEALAKFKIGNGQRMTFWTDLWEGETSFNVLFPRFFRIIICPKGLVAIH